MVKQGKYAQVSQVKKIRNLKNRLNQSKTTRTIKTENLAEFMLVRWHLISGKQPSLIQETTQRFLQSWLEQGQQQKSLNWSMKVLTTASLQRFNQQVPWQFYGILNLQWTRMQKFLIKELPAVPLTDPVILSDSLTSAQWQTLITQQLAVNSLLMMFQGDAQRLSQISERQVQSLSTSFLVADQIDWNQVAKIFAPLTVMTAESQDRTTKKWIADLTQLTAEQLAEK